MYITYVCASRNTPDSSTVVAAQPRIGFGFLAALCSMFMLRVARLRLLLLLLACCLREGAAVELKIRWKVTLTPGFNGREQTKT